MTDYYTMKQYIKKINKIFVKTINYFPIIGSFCVSKSKRDILWEDIFNSSKNNIFSKYDRKNIWFDCPNEKIVLKNCFYNDKYLIITTFNKILKKYNIFYYGEIVLTRAFINKILKEIEIQLNSNYTFVCYKKPKVKKFEEFIILKQCPKRCIGDFSNFIFEYNKLKKDVQATIKDLILDKSLEGFDFLIKKIKTIKKPIFCLVIENRIIGLIGPVNIFNDLDDNKIVSSFYFGIRADYRGKGYGKLLFKFFLNYCYNHNVKYFLVTNRNKSIAVKFYVSMGAKIANKYYKIKKNDLL